MRVNFFFGHILFLGILISCGGNAQKENESIKNEESNYDSQNGEGKFEKVDLINNLDVTLAIKGEKLHALKCASCHKLTCEVLVGPGWEKVTKRRTAVWLMNFMTNTEVMLEKDQNLKDQLETCKVRMPNQNLTDDEARQILEFMRKIDGIK